MSRRTTVHDILPLVAELSPRERIHLLRLMIARRDFDEAALYTAIPPGRDEFSSDEQPLAWEADGWEEFG